MSVTFPEPEPAAAPRLREALAVFGKMLGGLQPDGDDRPAAPLVAALRNCGLLRAPLPASHDGVDLAAPESWPALIQALRTIGGCDLAAARLFEGHVNAAILVRRYGTDRQKARFADTLHGGALSGVWGADGAAPLRAEMTTAGVRLEGAKILASGAGLAAAPIATAGTEAGPLMLLLGPLPETRIDLSAWRPVGMVGSATGRVDLSGLVLPPDSILGRAGDFLQQPHFSGGAWRFCAAHLGAAERLLDFYRAHLRRTDRGSDPYQLQRVATATAAVTTAAFWVTEAARRLADPHADAARTVAFANLTRTVTERAALDVLEAVQRGIGLTALVKPHPAERLIRDLTTYLRQPVPDLAMADAARAVMESDRPAAELWA